MLGQSLDYFIQDFPSTVWLHHHLPRILAWATHPPESGMSRRGERHRKLRLTPVYHVGIASTIIMNMMFIESLHLPQSPLRVILYASHSANEH